MVEVEARGKLFSSASIAFSLLPSLERFSGRGEWGCPWQPAESRVNKELSSYVTCPEKPCLLFPSEEAHFFCSFKIHFYFLEIWILYVCSDFCVYIFMCVRAYVYECTWVCSHMRKPEVSVRCHPRCLDTFSSLVFKDLFLFMYMCVCLRVGLHFPGAGLIGSWL